MTSIRKLIIIAVVVMMAACSGDKDTYQISGKLENGANATVYLMEMENESVRAVDTIILDGKGKFSVKEKLDNPSIFILQCPNDYIMLCPQVGEKIVLSGDVDNMAVTYNVSGSEESSKLKLLSDKQVMTRVALQNMSEQLKMTDIDDIDSVKHEVSRLYHSLRDNQKEFLINYINTNEGSLTTLVALYRNMENTPLIDFTNDFDVYKKVLNGLKKNYPDNKHTKNLEALIRNLDKLQQQQITNDAEK